MWTKAETKNLIDLWVSYNMPLDGIVPILGKSKHDIINKIISLQLPLKNMKGVYELEKLYEIQEDLENRIRLLKAVAYFKKK